MIDIIKCVESKKERLVDFRRYFHEHPELSQKEFATMNFIKNRLRQLGVPFTQVSRGGILAAIDGGRSGYTVLMRADMDALPIREDERNLRRNRTCISHNEGCSHACGHDCHMAMLLIAAEILAEHKNDWDGRVILAFEQAEELGDRGSCHLLKYLDEQRINVDVCLATHVRWDIPAGKAAVNAGGVMSGAFFFRGKIVGRGGHGARPDTALGPLEPFMAFASDLQAFRMRFVAPEKCLVYSFGQVHMGSEPNVIPQELTFAGTCRFFDEKDGLKFREKFHCFLKSECDNFDCMLQTGEEQYLPVAENDKFCSTVVTEAITGIYDKSVLYPADRWMASETFALYLKRYPGVLFFTGIKNDEAGCGAEHHTPKFDVDEKGLYCGTSSLLAAVLGILKEKPDLSHFKPTELGEMLKLMSFSEQEN